MANKNILKPIPNSNPPAGGPNSGKRAFTLIELVVVISITALIAGMVFANMRSGGRSVNINSDAEKLAGVIKQAQMMSLSGQQINGIRPDDGYGVYITTNSYKLFVNDNLGSSHLYEAEDTVVQSFDFTQYVEASPTGTTIIFIPPQSTIYVDGSQLGDPKTLILTQTQENLNAYVRIKAYGEVDVRKSP
ncbi:MAG: prepilin-type N-terminal cleavage/methylation domain-containing protein [Patescibacteria group bacterium]|nr:prepilin-type N-terminal cleavage/methylation domain-containing protein [Patescibacteria group bacterium]MDD5164808.1 prepilin-type N-terminal cleavage/methylation domain-containing protein [Patescibacteria group bacterium]MDD5534439.1 prepilin-type N-terminal cleavage/methylation domain-containing protein [Patescibacteria group bacterium]